MTATPRHRVAESVILVHQFFNSYTLNNDPNELLKYGGEQRDPLWDILK